MLKQYSGVIIQHDSFIARYIAIERHMYIATQNGLVPEMVFNEDDSITIKTNDGREVIYSMIDE
jgi:hypothetical protein